MARKNRRNQPPRAATVDTEVVDPPPVPAPSTPNEPLHEPSMLFGDLPDEVPGLDEPGAGLDDLFTKHPHLKEEIETAVGASIIGDKFDPAPVEPSPPNWEEEHTPPVAEVDLPRTGDALESLLSENAQLKEAVEIAQTTSIDNASEISRLRGELASSQSETREAREQFERAFEQGSKIEQLYLEVQAELDQLRLALGERDATIVEKDAAIASLDEMLGITTRAYEEARAAKETLENRLIDSELTRADIESQLDIQRRRVSELEGGLTDKKLWHVSISVEAGQVVPRIYVVARTVSGAVERAVKEGLTTADQVTMVTEIKGIQLIT